MSWYRIGGFRQGVSSLHGDIIDYTRLSTPTASEHEECERVIHAISKACHAYFGDSITVTPFGSYANGLATPTSDVDLVITGLMVPDTPEGYFNRSRALVSQTLRHLRNHLLTLPELGLIQAKLVAFAKVPLLKVKTSTRVMVDICINDTFCCKAAHYVLEMVRMHPSVRPICLVIKGFLRERGLSEVRNGGLGGYSLANMVIAHLFQLLKAGIPTHDFGSILLSFLYNFGYVFDPQTHAICVRGGGIVGRELVGLGQDPDERWFIENPVTGFNVAKGSYNIHMVRQEFAIAYNILSANMTSNLPVPLLSLLFDLHW